MKLPNYIRKNVFLVAYIGFQSLDGLRREVWQETQFGQGMKGTLQTTMVDDSLRLIVINVRMALQFV